MQNFIRGLNSRFSVFLISIAVIILAAIVFEQYMLSRQKEDARLIHLAGRQSMLIQKLTKLSLYIENDVQTGAVKKEDVEELRHIARDISKQHDVLVSFISSEHSSRKTDSLLVKADPLADMIVETCTDITHTNLAEVSKALNTIQLYDAPLSSLCEEILVGFQVHADKKMSTLKKAQYVIGICVFIAIAFGFVYILLPSVRKLRSGNKNLEDVNEQLTVSNEKLLNAEQNSRKNLEEIKRLHDDLSVKENQYRKLIESADTMIYEVDENGRFIFVNPITERVTGYSRGELYDKLLWEIIHPNHKDAAIQFYFQQRKRKQEHSYYELPIVTAKRKTIWIGQSASVFFPEQETEPVRMSIISRDVTNLKMTQLKLENSEKLYRLLSTNSKDLVSLYNYVDDTPILTYISPSVKDILGYTPEEFIGRTPFEIMLPEDAVKIRNTVYPALLTGKPTRSEYRVYKRDRSVAWLESFAEPFFEDGKVIGFQTSARDITQRIENEAKVNEARERAEQATLAKSQFLSMMSHEIRTPLNGIIGLTNFLLEDGASEEQQKYLKLLKFSGDNLLTIINDVLDFSKIEAQQIHLENIPFNLKNLLENALQTLRIRANDKGLPLMLSYDSKLPEIIKGDPVRLSQVFNNLVSNAIKFTETGFISVQALFSGTTIDGKTSITFSVKDTGMGIPEDKLDYIFESFTQATTDTSRKFGGTGLGLSITKRLIQLMGGNIIVVSELGEGAEFTFSLVFEEAELRDETVQKSVSTQQNIKKLSVLLVDDNDVNLIVAANYLKKWGFRVSTAANGLEALELIKQKAFNVVLMDLQMPEMDGYEATSTIRSLDEPYFKEVPIIALTASAMIEDIQRLSKVGLNDYVAKPFNPQDLQEKILKHALSEVPGIPIDEHSLDAYTGGDEETRKILILRMVDNLKELQAALHKSVEDQSDELYRKALHKMQTTLSILNDEQFKTNLELLKTLLSNQKEIANKLIAEVELFSQQSNNHIEKLLEDGGSK